MIGTEDPVPIDHARIIDGLRELEGETHYQPREVKCGDCGVMFTFSPSAQRYVHEVRGVPVKMAERGSVFCARCVPPRAEANRARRRLNACLNAHSAAQVAWVERPDDVGAVLEAVRTGIALREIQAGRAHPQGGEALIAMARRGARLEPTDPRWRYWEGRAQLAANHRERALATLRRFVDEARDHEELGSLTHDAAQRIAESSGDVLAVEKK